MTEKIEPGGAPLVLRDDLAVDRTVLANERTLLAYIRTALGLLLAGASAVSFFDSILLVATGWLFIAAGAVAVVVGVARFVRLKRRLENTRGQ